MTSSGTYAFNPSAGDVVLNAFGMIQLRRWELTQQHLEDAAFCCNLVMVDFSNRNPNQWALEDLTITPLTQGTPAYSLEDRTIAVAIAYIDTTTGTDVRSRVLGPISNADYASLPNKLTEGPPTSYDFRLLRPTPEVRIWPVADANGPYTLRLQTFRQIQDVVLPNGVTLDAPYRFLDAFTHDLASRLAEYYPPAEPGKGARLSTMAAQKFQLAASRDQESTPMYVRPMMGGYFR